MSKQEIGRAITQFREANNITRYNAITKRGVKLTYKQLADIEAGNKNYTIDSLLEYTAAIGMKIKLH